MTASGYTTNPKRIIYIPKSNIKLSFKRDPITKLINMFSFEGVNFSGIYGSTTMSQDAEMFLEIRNRKMKCKIVKPPFYKNGTLLS